MCEPTVVTVVLLPLSYSTIQYNTLQYNTVQYITVHYSTLQLQRDAPGGAAGPGGGERGRPTHCPPLDSSTRQVRIKNSILFSRGLGGNANFSRHLRKHPDYFLTVKPDSPDFYNPHM